jgi:hypothetical protein
MTMSFIAGNWVLGASALLALIVAGAGVAKLLGVPMVYQSFAVLGLPRWFGYFIGAAEVAGAVGLFIRPLASWAALGLAIIGVGAVGYHVLHPPVAEGIPAMVVLGLSVAIFLARRR